MRSTADTVVAGVAMLVPAAGTLVVFPAATGLAVASHTQA